MSALLDDIDERLERFIKHAAIADREFTESENKERAAMEAGQHTRSHTRAAS